MKTKFLLVLVLIIAFSASAFAKIGVVDFQKVLKESAGGKDAYAKLQSKADEYDKKLTEMSDAIKNLQQDYAAKESVYDDAAKDKKRSDIQKQIRDFNQTKDDYAKDLKRIEMRYLKGIQDDVLKIVESMGKELGLEVVLEQSNSGVLYMDPKIDITDNVIQRYNNVFKQQPAKTGK